MLCGTISTRIYRVPPAGARECATRRRPQPPAALPQPPLRRSLRRTPFLRCTMGMAAPTAPRSQPPGFTFSSLMMRRRPPRHLADRGGATRAAYTRTSDRSGTCALAVLLRGSKLHVASVGDCRTLLVSGEHTYQQLTTDQRASEPAERARILECGGEISADGRVWGSLIPSRTLGDFPWKDRDGGRALSSLPACASFSVLPTHKYLVLGSDGLFDVLQNRTIARLIGRLNSGAQRACNELVKEIKKRPGTDDTTVIVIHFERDRQRECSADKLFGAVRRSVTV
ncbi:hypothetical protein EMIHUDRAFT_457657 [Emiliania huxleyi CCMP1516]|uniref:PPM-type phosphatase domain-containing protein n=2 Tax=Emiliania huxleyi TaxID=2903 RepID=A0A0D3JN59_EMIH1|nr:hypothetical protein EMIHUDRAFT_457657 [Emiliania huxleyi CCMP1516]EOD24944.1 hypothetical protein EMIHUDRAFT_457657 [Emiliania huxleyi CCMP1516]|eukprot:XP_005777373.1 hypothetical protein EMIHUDRAFT_457657 [Emiliania huxleyi CCMP1516]